MRILLLIEVVTYFGLLALQAYWQVRGILTDRSFALFQVAQISLIMITAGLYYAVPDYPFGLAVFVVATAAFTALGYPIARWIYRQVFPPK